MAMKNPNQNPNIPIIENNFYWVKPFEKDYFEPAKCRNRSSIKDQSKLFFCFTNGSVIEVERAWEFKPLQYSEI
jgi:hypothetical protein